ncbi:MAG: hypothetical protein AVDCRST_MAG68-3041 [uncultured Gemmatimonadetes bacterium]|uniref:Uncharacterized protein n=1 Tax=uncultured Gemmatimonadota bacterium TaxID=203437 RepID=A0A6J4LSH9_9BACT|nr:MAG: hypothetical protein AVDCRST_MAG68-3041 [uncultured Gemmatimonadota bacterium]
MHVSVAELRESCELLLTHLEQSGSASVELTSDLYWNVPQDQRYQAYEEPKSLDMGQLSQDWAEVQAIVRGEKEPLGYALVWLSSILRAVGEKTVG